MPLILALETSTARGGAALIQDATLVAEASYQRSKGHAETLHPLLEQLLEQSQVKTEQIDAVAVSFGPGAFTALRVGLATAKGLAYALAKPLIGLDTLEVMCCNIPHGDRLLVPLIDARKNEVCGAIFRRKQNGELTVVQKQFTLKAAELAKLLTKRKPKMILFGPGARLYQRTFSRQLGTKADFLGPLYDYPQASALAYLALNQYKKKRFTDPFTAVPVYLRPSEADSKS